jgi:hypothetical protein
MKVQRRVVVYLYSSFNLGGTRWGVAVECYALATQPLRMTQYLLYRRPGGLQGQSGWVLKISPLQGFDP